MEDLKSYRIKIDLLKLQGASLKNVNLNGQQQRYLLIPIDNADGIFVGQKGCYLSMRATPIQNRKFEDTHCVRVSLSKERIQSLTKEQIIEQIPILGGMQVNEYQQQQSMQVNDTIDASAFQPVYSQQTVQQSQQLGVFGNEAPF